MVVSMLYINKILMGNDIDQMNRDSNRSYLQWILFENIVLQQESVQIAIQNQVLHYIF